MNNIVKINENMVKINNVTTVFDREIDILEDVVMLTESHSYNSPDFHGDAKQLTSYQGYYNSFVKFSAMVIEKGRWFSITGGRIDGLVGATKDNGCFVTKNLLWGFFSGNSLYISNVEKKIYNTSRVI